MPDNSSTQREDPLDTADLEGSLVFICYSSEDEGPTRRLRRQLALALGGDESRVRVWSDDDIKPGDEWRKAIRDALDRARVAILMISLDWFESDFIAQEEVPRLLERRQQGLLQIIPVITAQCRFQDTWVGQLQYVPRVGTLQQRVQERHQLLALFSDKWKVIDEELTTIATMVAKALDPAAGKSEPRQRRARKPDVEAPGELAVLGNRQGAKAEQQGARKLGSANARLTIDPRQARGDVAPEAQKGSWS